LIVSNNTTLEKRHRSYFNRCINLAHHPCMNYWSVHSDDDWRLMKFGHQITAVLAPDRVGFSTVALSRRFVRRF
jgi:hypothetical protein